jgi:hypothetical protein
LPTMYRVENSNYIKIFFIYIAFNSNLFVTGITEFVTILLLLLKKVLQNTTKDAESMFCQEVGIDLPLLAVSFTKSCT